MALEAELGALAAGFSGRLGVYAEHLASGEQIAWNADRSFETASTIKLAILAELHRQADAGRLSLDEPAELVPGARCDGTGVLKDLGLGLRLPLRDLAALMVTVSDNVATNLLIDRLGLSAVNRCLAQLGLRRTRLLRRFTPPLSGPVGRTTPREMARLMALVARGEAASRQACEGMRAVLERQQYQAASLRYIPYEWLVPARPGEGARVRLASKSGSLDGVRNDVGLWSTLWGDWVLALYSEGCADRRYHVDNEALLVLPRAARLVCDHFAAQGGGATSP